MLNAALDVSMMWFASGMTSIGAMHMYRLQTAGLAQLTCIAIQVIFRNPLGHWSSAQVTNLDLLVCITCHKTIDTYCVVQVWLQRGVLVSKVLCLPVRWTLSVIMPMHVP